MTTISINEFYDYEQLTEKLRELEAADPDLVSLSSIGKSRDERELWCVTIASNREELPVDRRPAFLVTANMHARELAGSWVSLYFIRHLIEQFSESEDVTRLLEEQTIYVVPRVTPDGADDVLESRHPSLRSRDIDIDDSDRRPGALYAEDVNDDGEILTMRWQDEDGEKAVHPDDDRQIVDRTPDSQGPFYRTELEGVVHEFNGGEIVEHEVRSDFNRNFPSEAWEPFDWYGHGEYPLSEPETQALADFILEHPHIKSVADLHTGNPAIFYPRKLADPNEDYANDADLIEEIGTRGEEITGFPYLSSYGEAVTGEPATSALPGSFKDYLYERIGLPAFTVELGMLYNSLGFETGGLTGRDHELEVTRQLLEYHDKNPEYGLFREWETYNHPQLGTVEIGGWDMVRFANPPREEMPDVAERTTEFLLEYAAYTTSVRVRNLTAESLGDSLYKITADIINDGSLPTNVTDRRLETSHNNQPLVHLSIDDTELITGQRYTEIDHLEANRGRCSLEWVVRAPAGIEVKLHVSAPGVFAYESITLEECSV